MFPRSFRRSETFVNINTPMTLGSNSKNKIGLSHDVASESGIKSCNKIDKQLVIYRFVAYRNDLHYNVT